MPIYPEAVARVFLVESGKPHMRRHTPIDPIGIRPADDGEEATPIMLVNEPTFIDAGGFRKDCLIVFWADGRTYRDTAGQRHDARPVRVVTL